jgi:hypothetical protein
MGEHLALIGLKGNVTENQQVAAIEEYDVIHLCDAQSVVPALATRHVMPTALAAVYAGIPGDQRKPSRSSLH